MSARAVTEDDHARSPASCHHVVSASDRPLSVERLLEGEYSASRMRGGACDGPRMYDEPASYGTPSSVGIPLIIRAPAQVTA
jgi:hypothetical protein